MKSHPSRHKAATEITQKHSRPGKSRLDVLIAERGLASSRERAQALLLAGNILVNGQKMEKPGTQVAIDSRIEIIGETLRYASRGGLKLEGALEDFGVSPQDKVCLDIGSSTGGFTDCLLQSAISATRRYRRAGCAGYHGRVIHFGDESIAGGRSGGSGRC